MKNIIFVYVSVIAFLVACNSKNEKNYITYYGTGTQPKEEFIYEVTGDTSSYEYISFYPNGIMKSKGKVIHSRRQGPWQEWYADGAFRREIEYRNNYANTFSRNRKIPTLIFSSDTLRVGVPVYIRFIDSYPNDGLSCDNGIIKSVRDKSHYDFEVIPARQDSIRFFYPCVPCLINEDSDSNNIKSIFLKSLWVY